MEPKSYHFTTRSKNLLQEDRLKASVESEAALTTKTRIGWITCDGVALWKNALVKDEKNFSGVV